MTPNRLLRDVANRDERWREAAEGIVNVGWGLAEQRDYWGIRIADAVILERTSLGRVSQQLDEASYFHQQVLGVTSGILESLRGEDCDEALVRRVAYVCLRNGKNRVRTEKHRRRHLANYQGRVSLLRSTANIGLGCLEPRDLSLDDLWYDKEEL
ncbi:MAG TPA: hypothetical protein VK712_01045 [Verrucomicrobiae bacterium]|jgi:hypothetical protein|nr:hypothetical protein [Verrucomicrobiae bacterium]